MRRIIIRKKETNRIEFSKKLILSLTIYNMVLTVWAFVLMTLSIEVPEGIIIALISGLFGEFSGYLLKAFFGKKNEEATRLMEAQMEKENTTDGLD